MARDDLVNGWLAIANGGPAFMKQIARLVSAGDLALSSITPPANRETDELIIGLRASTPTIFAQLGESLSKRPTTAGDAPARPPALCVELSSDWADRDAELLKTAIGRFSGVSRVYGLDVDDPVMAMAEERARERLRTRLREVLRELL